MTRRGLMPPVETAMPAQSAEDESGPAQISSETSLVSGLAVIYAIREAFTPALLTMYLPQYRLYSDSDLDTAIINEVEQRIKKNYNTVFAAGDSEFRSSALKKSLQDTLGGSNRRSYLGRIEKMRDDLLVGTVDMRLLGTKIEFCVDGTYLADIGSPPWDDLLDYLRVRMFREMHQLDELFGKEAPLDDCLDYFYGPEEIEKRREWFFGRELVIQQAERYDSVWQLLRDGDMLKLYLEPLKAAYEKIGWQEMIAYILANNDPSELPAYYQYIEDGIGTAVDQKIAQREQQRAEAKQIAKSAAAYKQVLDQARRKGKKERGRR